MAVVRVVANAIPLSTAKAKLELAKVKYIMNDENYKDKLKNFAREKSVEYTVEKSEPLRNELVKFSDAAHETGYKVSYELAEVTLPPEMAQEVEHQLRISTDKIKKENADNLDAASSKFVVLSTNAIFDVVTGEKDFDEASRAVAAQTKVIVKEIVIEKGKQVAIQEGKRIFTDLAGKSAQNLIAKTIGRTSPALKVIAFGNMIKDNVLDYVDGKISDEQFIKEVSKKGTLFALETVGAFAGVEILSASAKLGATLGQSLIPIPVAGAVIGSAVTSIACQGLMVAANATLELWNASKIQIAADRRKIISKIKTDALTEMERQRTVMKEYFADEKLKWDNNIKEGFELIASGSYANNIEVIAQGLDRILQNFGRKVAFSNYEEFDEFFMDDDTAFKL